MKEKIVRLTVKKNCCCDYCKKKLKKGNHADLYISKNPVFDDDYDRNIYHPECLDKILIKLDSNKLKLLKLSR